MAVGRKPWRSFIGLAAVEQLRLAILEGRPKGSERQSSLRKPAPARRATTNWGCRSALSGPLVSASAAPLPSEGCQKRRFAGSFEYDPLAVGCPDRIDIIALLESQPGQSVAGKVVNPNLAIRFFESSGYAPAIRRNSRHHVIVRGGGQRLFRALSIHPNEPQLRRLRRTRNIHERSVRGKTILQGQDTLDDRDRRSSDRQSLRVEGRSHQVCSLQIDDVPGGCIARENNRLQQISALARFERLHGNFGRKSGSSRDVEEKARATRQELRQKMAEFSFLKTSQGLCVASRVGNPLDGATRPRCEGNHSLAAPTCAEAASTPCNIGEADGRSAAQRDFF